MTRRYEINHACGHATYIESDGAGDGGAVRSERACGNCQPRATILAATIDGGAYDTGRTERELNGWRSRRSWRTR